VFAESLASIETEHRDVELFVAIEHF
jgi:hypothetical protein